MAVQFTAADYLQNFILICLGSLVGCTILALAVGLPLARKTGNPLIAMIPLLLFIPVMTALFQYVIPAGERTDCLYPPERAYTHTTAGTITAVRPADHIPLYYYGGEFRGGVYVTMDGVEYYSMDHPLLTEGTSLHFTYCPDQDLIMAFSPINADKVAALQAPFVMPEPVPEEPVPEVQQIIGSVLHGIGLLGVLAFVLLERMFSGKLAGILQERDRRQRFEVIPNPAGALLLIAFLVPFALLIFGDTLATGDFGALFILCLAALMMLGITRFGCARIRLEGRNIRIRQYGRERTAPLSSLRSVYWDSSRHLFSQRQLILEFEDGPLRLDQESHLGLEDLHRRLSALLKTVN